jgi:hypothetical protein
MPADAPLPRERAKAPYSQAQIAGFLALADAQPTVPRRMRAAGLVCLGAAPGWPARTCAASAAQTCPAGPEG